MPNKLRRRKISPTSKRSNRPSRSSNKTWQVSITTTAEGEEAVGCMLERLFQLAPVAYCDEATGVRTITVYPKVLGGPAAAVRAQLCAGLRELDNCGLRTGKGKIVVRPLPEKNWAESWKHHFKPIDVDGVLLVRPGWIRRKVRNGQHLIVLDPGLSFGTGHHPTTLFCLQRLVQCRKTGQRQSFLDIGTGSGILAIAAAKLGFQPVEGFDNDPVAVRVARQNLRRNRVNARVSVKQKDLAKLRENGRKFDVICANLVYDLLASEASTICARLKPGGTLIVAGILRQQFDKLVTVLCRFGLTLGARKTDGTWQSGEFVLRWP